METKTPTLRQFMERFPTEEACLAHLMLMRFGDRHACDKCGKDAKFYRVKARRSYACEHCGAQVYPTAGTPFDRTRTSLRDWFYVMFLFCSTRNGVAAKEVQRQIGVTYKTAWRMCHEIRKYMAKVDGDDMLGGEGERVEVDETLIGGKTKGQGKFREGKTYVLGMLERGGNVMTKVVSDARRSTLLPEITANVAKGTEVHTDYLHSYRVLPEIGYIHKKVNHSSGQYVGPSGEGVNAIEGFWAQLKRGINGTHIHVSPKHLATYLGEFEYRYNMRHAPHLMLARMMVSFAR